MSPQKYPTLSPPPSHTMPSNRLHPSTLPYTLPPLTQCPAIAYPILPSSTPHTQCPAIDYTRHTLDGAACLLNSTRYFPSRVSIKESSVVKLGSVCRRVYRIFSHAFYHHRNVFDEYEVRGQLRGQLVATHTYI